MFSLLIKIPVNILSSVFWFFWGGLIQIRVIVIKVPVYAVQTALAPYGDGRPPPETSFEKTMNLWWRGFAAIWSNLKVRDTSGPDWDDAPTGGFWSALGRFLWESFLNVLFYVPVLFALHHVGLWRIDAIERLEGQIASEIGFEISGSDERETNSAANCLGANSVNRWNPPRSYRATERVRLRQGPSRAHEELGHLSAGQTVLVMGATSGAHWYLVSVDGELRCFVSAEYLQRN